MSKRSPSPPPSSVEQSAPAPVPADTKPLADVSPAAASSTTQPVLTTRVPRLVDLGADKCIPCKKMAPILEELKTTMVGKLQVDFIDVTPATERAWKRSLND